MLFGCTTILLIFASYTAGTTTSTENSIESIEPETYYYFAYGSNMLSERIHLSIPSIRKVGGATIKDYILGFEHFALLWNTGAATLYDKKNVTTYGVIYETNRDGMKTLDWQEGVHTNFYYRTKVIATLLETESNITAFTYRVVENPTPSEFERMPSKTYLQCIVKGAQENGLPKSYIRWLKQIKHNGLIAPELDRKLNLSSVNLGVEDDEDDEI